MKYEIMLKILFELLAKKQVTATYLANKHELSVRTVYRYIEQIEYAGVPVETVRGVNGGFRILPSYRLAGGFLTEEEYEATLSALSGFNAEINDQVIDSAISKIRSTRRGGREVSVSSGNFVVDSGPWSNTDGYKDKLNAVAEAIDDKTVLSIVYHDRNGEKTERKIEPHVLAFKQGMWYVYAFCRARNGFRFFKISRIAELKREDEIFTRKEIAEPLPFAGFYGESDTVKVKMQISRDALADAEEWLGVENVKERDDGFFAETELPDDNGLVAKIMSFAGGVRVLSPQRLVDKITAAANKILGN